MRIIGLVLVLIGALALAYETFRERARAGGNPPTGEQTLWIPPVVAGITLVSGLILTAAAYRSKEE